MNHPEVISELQNLSDPKKAEVFRRFFKTGKGQYGEGDKFIGLTVPEQRKIAKKFIDLPLSEIQKLLSSKIHEYRFTSLAILVLKYKSGTETEKKKIFNFYLKNKKWVNNWDLVDVSAANIVGNYLLDKNRAVLFKLAKSKNLWDKRIAIVSTQEFIRNNQFEDTLKIAKILLKDEHDLIHKASGWMLREVGKKSKPALEKFLKKYSKTMPRTELRYAIERFPEKERKAYLIS